MKPLLVLLVVLVHVYAQETVSNPDNYDQCAQWFDRNYTIPANIEDYRERYDIYLKKFEKTYSSQEKECRLRVYAHNLVRMETIKRKHRKAHFGENKFTDWTRAEKRSLFGGLKEIKNPLLRPPLRSTLKTTSTKGCKKTPKHVDWVAEGKVTPVEDQGGCGSCWAFATTASIESAFMINRDLNISLSEQQLMDCDRAWNAGCAGGFYAVAMDYIIKNGIYQEKDYPYTEKNTAQCQLVNAEKFYINGYQWLPPNDVKEQTKWIAEHGPVAAGIAPVPKALDYLATAGGREAVGEVLIPAGNCTEEIYPGSGHAVTIVGYGTENGTDYWLLKNSWGKTWGNSGYYKFVRGINACGIESRMVAPILQ